MILLGDVNVNYLKSNNNVKIKRVLLINGFTQVVTKPTRMKIVSSILIKTVEVIAASLSVMVWSAV